MEIKDREIGSFFDECARNGFMESFSDDEEKKLRAILDMWNITPGQRICEPGCGTGRLTKHIAQAVGTEGNVYACDLSEEMIEKACERNLPGYVKFVHGPVDSIHAGEEYFDKVICFNVFPHFSNPSQALAEINRVLKPGGHLWVTHLKKRKEVNETHRHGSPVIISHQIPEAGTMRKLFTDAGFEVLDIEDLGDIKNYCLHAVKH